MERQQKRHIQHQPHQQQPNLPQPVDEAIAAEVEKVPAVAATTAEEETNTSPAAAIAAQQQQQQVKAAPAATTEDTHAHTHAHTHTHTHTHTDTHTHSKCRHRPTILLPNQSTTTMYHLSCAKPSHLLGLVKHTPNHHDSHTHTHTHTLEA